MTRSKTLAAAEKKALEGKNESQDSQYVLDQYRVVYGIGVVRRAILAFSCGVPPSGGAFLPALDVFWGIAATGLIATFASTATMQALLRPCAN